MADLTTASILIDASTDAIMDVIADLERYPEWSDGVKRVEVLTEFEDGRPATARFNLDAGAVKDTYELEYEWDDDSVSWTLTKGSVLKSMDGTYALAPHEDGGTTVFYRLEIDLSIPMIGLIKRKAERVIVDTALKGLKKRVEG